ncbi:MAG: alanine dehydrogenase [Bacteroidota bacterium]
MTGTKQDFPSFAKFETLMPQEEKLEVGRKKSRLFIGIPKETFLQENRVTLVPDSVSLLVNNGHTVVIEKDAGKAANFQDNDYSEAGGKIVKTAEEVYKADIIMKVAPLTLKEIDLLQRRQTIFSTLLLPVQPKDYIKKLIFKKVTAIAFDTIKGDDGIYPVIRSMGEIAGNTAVLIAAELLSNVNQGKGLMLGGVSGVTPTEVVILGAGTVGEFAARAALGLGAIVKVFDNSLSKLRRLQNVLGTRVFTCIFQPEVLKKELKRADVAIGAVRAPDKRTPCMVSEEMVKEMKFGSVIVDVCIDQGGCFETSRVTNHNEPVYRQFGVVHYCVPNIASRVARTASYALSNIFAPILINMGEEGGIDNMLRVNRGVRHGVYLYSGILTSKMLGEAFNIPYKDIDLLMVAF